MSQVIKRTQELKTAIMHTQGNPAETEVPQMFQKKQGISHLAYQSLMTKVKLDDMAGYLVAGDSFPSAAILAPWLPRLKVVVDVVVYALLECQQGIPLAPYAPPTGRMGRFKMPCVVGEEEAAPSCRHKEQDEHRRRAMHGDGEQPVVVITDGCS